MSRTPEEPGEPATETAEQPASSQQQPGQQSPELEQELTLEQLDAHITEAEGLHKDLSARLDSIPRD
ncbi:hypothetical protein [Garicola koreensis]|uniref:Uncharacterized protein n=1 Tax=Garicola koreensis TaxID=1262554 RepID=A0A7W5TNN2_9MICC|nr:hypothetical protein [Garicola koreensis]MBB3666746.1 hypothetical protein [Garicola koreensis]